MPPTASPSAPNRLTSPTSPGHPRHRAPTGLGPTAQHGRTSSARLTRRHLLTLVPLAVGLLASCSSSSPQGTPLTSGVAHKELSLGDVTSLEAAVAACDALGAAMLTDALTTAPDANAVVSPLSLALALALVADGASDPAAQGYDAALGASGEDRDRTWSAVQTSVGRHDRDLEGFDPEELPTAPLVHVANHVVVLDDAEVEQSYLDTVLRWFTAEIERVDRGQAAANLDAWVKRHTAGLIKRSAIQVTADLRVVLQNAVLFAARWGSAFDEEDTGDREFTLAGGSVVTARRMHQDLDAAYAEGEGWQALRLPYSGGSGTPGQSTPEGTGSGGLVMDVVLPAVGTLPADMDASTWARASAALDDAEETTVHLGLPALDLTSPSRDLLPLLGDLGVDLGPLDAMGPDLVVGQVAQQTRLIVDEEGTVAAAVTEAEVGVTAAAPPDGIDFLIDRPYVLRLRDTASGVALFEAAVMDPSSTS